MKRKNIKNPAWNLFSKLVLVAAMIVGGSSFAWAQKSLPYNYGFEATFSDEGWTSYNLYSGSLSSEIISSSTSYPANNGSYLFKFYGAGTTQYIISPELNHSDTGIEFSVYYNGMLNSGSGTRTFYLGYSTTTADVSSFTWEEHSVNVSAGKAWCQSENTSCPTGTKYVAIKYTAAFTMYFDDLHLEAQERYKAPKNLTVNSVTSSSVMLSWTNGRDETAWQIAYSTDEDFTPSINGTVVDVNSNPESINGLTDGYTYYVAVRSNYGDGYSSWTDKIAVTPGIESTIYSSNTNENSYIPFYGKFVSNANKTKGQFIISSSDLTDIGNRSITKLTFYTKNVDDYEKANWGNARFDIYLNTTTESSYSGTDYYNEGIKVAADAELIVSNYKMEIKLDVPFIYTSNNLLITFIQTIQGTNKSVSWYGKSGTYSIKTGLSTYTNSSTPTTAQYYFTPRITFTTVPPTASATTGTNGYTTFACPRPLDLTTASLPEGLKAYKAAVDGTKVLFTDINQTVPANTGMLLEGTANTTYAIPVAENGSTPDGNDFLVNSTGGTFTAEAGYSYFGLIKDSDPLTFGIFAPGTVAIPSNKAYLKVLTSSLSASRQLTCVFGDDTEGIQGVEKDTQSSEVYYNLAGLRVEKPSKGLYIVNGKKVVIK